jgi:hypothetical protein
VVIPALQRLRQEDYKFKASLGYIVRLKHKAITHEITNGVGDREEAQGQAPEYMHIQRSRNGGGTAKAVQLVLGRTLIHKQAVWIHSPCSVLTSILC